MPEGDRLGSQPTGNTTSVVDEHYASPDGIAHHWQATIVTLHNGTVVQAL